MFQEKQFNFRRASLVTVLMLFFAATVLPAATLNDTQVIKSDHWIYDAIYTLYTKSGKTCPGNSFPTTVGQLKFLLRQIDTSELDISGTRVYEETYNFLYERTTLGKRLGIEADEEEPSLRVGAEIRLNPEAYYKSNSNVNWYTFRTDPYFVDNFATIPVLVGFEDLITMEADFYYGKNLDVARKKDNYFNLATGSTDSDYLLPRFAYGSTGLFKDKWGLSFHIATNGHSIGKTQTGSIIYNRTFETMAYTELNLYSNKVSYALDVSQLDYNRFSYLHHIEIRPFDKFKFSIVEGGMAVSHLELRYLNPFMIIHSFRPADEYKQSEVPGTNDADHRYCAYLGISLEFVPCKNVRTYVLWAQDEMQVPSELTTNYGKMLADAFGIQGGAEIFLPSNTSRTWKLNFESIYTLPYLYIKYSAQSSLYRARKKITYVSGGSIKSWIGTPLGPDCLAFQTGITCADTGKWSAGLSYLLTIHGEISFDIFTDQRWAFEVDGKTYYAYYPSVKYAKGFATAEESIAEARNKWLTGTLEHRHDIVLNGTYTLNKNFSFDGQFVYTFVFNNGHNPGNFQQGVELAISATFKYF